MSILINKDTRVVISGITGNTGSFHTRQCMEYGSKIVAEKYLAEVGSADGKQE